MLIYFLFLTVSMFFGVVYGASPIRLNVGVYVRSVSMNNKEQQATIDLYYWYRFKMPEDTSDLASYYDLEITNGDLLFNEIQEDD